MDLEAGEILRELGWIRARIDGFPFLLSIDWMGFKWQAGQRAFSMFLAGVCWVVPPAAWESCAERRNKRILSQT